MNFDYQWGGERKFDIDTLSDNEFNDWIGADKKMKFNINLARKGAPILS